ncbi:rod shape-determining protein MreC [Paratissierella segnis]|jgi:rod shape-determining protein MreC|uniref:Cell shape-determining protein MreC n=1 Tax=Paratissierella segnis TaxID=2763679 RepID=A0A926ESA6_9FIRM|nr:rod shape-determining protein MreC [Paratissierella segnis]MBC8588843.1 rod shape-determining protein MreC [Paratissierella segnis]
MYFFKKYKDRMIISLVALILLIIIGNTSKDRMNITVGENLVGNLLTPISKVSFSATKSIKNFFDSIFNITNIKKENEELKIKVAELEKENRDLTNIIGKTDYLKNESEIVKNTKYNLVMANIVGKEPSNWYNRFDIDKGLKDGITKGATVVQGIEIEHGVVEEGIIGRVADVGDNWAKIISIVDELNSISFKVIRTQDGGVLSGSIEGSIEGILNGYLFDNKADVIVGDKLYTSGLGGTFIKDIYIGEVSEVILDEEELSKKVIIEPAIDFKKLYKVCVIKD